MIEYRKYPYWLELSGLPEQLNKAIPPYGYFVFKKVIELDLYKNRCPEVIETSLKEMSKELGIDIKAIENTLRSLEEQKYLRIFWGTNPKEELCLCINIPIETPVKANNLIAKYGNNEQKGLMNLPYMQETEVDLDSDEPDEKEYFQIKYDQIINWYMQSMNGNLNPTVLQKLKKLCREFKYQELKQAFEKARKNKNRNLQCLTQELYSWKN